MSPERGQGWRTALHAATGLLALLLGVLPRGAALACAGLGVLAGWVVFPWSGLEARLRRPGESWPGGLRTYPIAVLGLVLLLPPAQAAAAWAILAWGDAAAATVGRTVPAPHVLRGRKATWSGSLAHVLVGGTAAWGSAAAVAFLAARTGAIAAGPVPGPLACALAASGAAAVDALLPLPDDNVTGAAAAGLVLHLAQPLLV